MATPKIIADFETQLATALAVGGTSFTLSSATDDDGVALPTGKYYFTIDNGTSQKEYVVGTLASTAVTSVSNVTRQGSESSGVDRAHRVGASVIMTDFLTYKNYIDETTVAGAADANASTKGVVEVPTAAEINAGTSVGGTGASLAISPDQLELSNYGVLLASLVGVISPYSGSSAPTGFLLCDGTAVSRTTYADLFAVTSTTYGVGDGSTTFNLPNLKGSVPVGRDSAQTEFDTLGETGGAKTHTLTEAEMPSHTHTALGQNVGGATVGGVASNGTASTTGATGGDGAHNNLQPYIVLNYIIKT